MKIEWRSQTLRAAILLITGCVIVLGANPWSNRMYGTTRPAARAYCLYRPSSVF